MIKNNTDFINPKKVLILNRILNKKKIIVKLNKVATEKVEDKDLETLKHDYGSAKKECIDQAKTIILNVDNREIAINEYELADIIQSRISCKSNKQGVFLDSCSEK